MKIRFDSASLGPGPVHDITVRPALQWQPTWPAVELYWLELDEVEDLAGDGLLVEEILVGVERLQFTREFGAPNTYAERLVFGHLENGKRRVWEPGYHLTLRVVNHGKAPKSIGGSIVGVPVRVTRHIVDTCERLEPEPKP